MGRGEAWYWTIRMRAAPDRMIGSISLQAGDTENRGFWLIPEYRGKGLASEAADAVTDFWFDTLRFPVLRVPKATINGASRRISEKQGMRVVATEERDYVSGRYATEIWEITAEDRPELDLYGADGEGGGKGQYGGYWKPAVADRSDEVSQHPGGEHGHHL